MAYTTINKSKEHFNTKLYTGTGSSNAQTGVGFQPDLIWFKNRTSTYWHQLYDVVRGVNKSIASNATNAQENRTDNLNSFDTDGFTVGAEGGDKNVNYSGDNYVAWNWKANGAGSANTDGTISSTVSVNTTSGFSIVKWTGSNANATIGHGLGVVPKMIIVKNRATATSWMVYHVTQGATKFLRLNTTDAVATGSTPFNDTTPTSSVFSVGANGDTNGSSQEMIAYCFAEKKGYSKFGSYTGNGNADGTFVYTGFKPAFVMVKNTTDGSTNWCLFDNKRDTSNPNSIILLPNSNDADINASSINTDFLSNGFKLRNTDNDRNGSGDTHIYMAFAEAPLVGTNGVTAKAR